MKKYMVSLVFLVLGICCMIGYRINPNYVAEDGTLVESFAFIPLTYIFFFLAIISTLVIVSRSRMKVQ